MSKKIKAIDSRFEKINSFINNRVNLGTSTRAILNAINGDCSLESIRRLGEKHAQEINDACQLDRFSNAFFMALLEFQSGMMTRDEIKHLNIQVDFVIRNMKMAYQVKKDVSLFKKIWSK